MVSWTCVLELGEDRSVSAGSEIALCDAIRRGADLRIGTEFRHNEHIDVTSDSPEVFSMIIVPCPSTTSWITGMPVRMHRAATSSTDFDLFRFLVRDDWQEVVSQTADGRVVSGSVDTLAEAFTEGCKVKVGIRGLCADLMADRTTTVDHEVFIQTGSCYYYTQRGLFIAGTHPVVRVTPAIPLGYVSQGWDFGWLMPRTDGVTARLLCHPYTLTFSRSEERYAIRWFVR